MSEWLKINTAPKDGRVVDLWHPEEGRIPNCAWVTAHIPFGGEGTGWFRKHDEFGLSDVWLDDEYEYPTHWMPLPEPPPQAARAKGA